MTGFLQSPVGGGGLLDRAFRQPRRVQFDPNGLAPGEPQYHVVTRGDFLDDGGGPGCGFDLFPGEPVTVVVEGDDGDPDLIGMAHVVRVNDAHGLVYLNVEADSFQEEWPHPWRRVVAPSSPSLAIVSGGVEERYIVERQPISA